MLLGIHLEELKTYVHTKTCTQMCLTISFHDFQNWEVTRMSFSRGMDKLWSIQTIETWYSALKRNEYWSHEETWRNLKCIYSAKDGNLKGLHTVEFQLWHFGEGKTMETGNDQWLPGVGGRGAEWVSIGNFRAVNDSVWHYRGGYMALYICPNIQNVHQKAMLMPSMDFGWWWCVNIGSSL